MKPVWLGMAVSVVAFAVPASGASAQNAPVQATPLPSLPSLPPLRPLPPLPPLQRQQWQQQASPSAPLPAALPVVIGPGAAVPDSGPPGFRAPDSLGQAPSPAPSPAPPPAASSPAAPPPDAPASAPPATVQRPNAWVPAAVAKLQALDKVNAQATALTIKVGQSATFGSLTITVRACVTRPADQPSDAAAYLDVADSHPDQPGFDGWMLEDEPAVSMMQHPIYDLRVTGCA